MDFIYYGKFDSEGKNSWISSVKEEVIKYNEDELCGFKISNQMFIDMMSGSKIINRFEKNKEITKDIPMFLISGDDDPVGNFGKDIKKLFNRYKENNLKEVKYKVYNAIRHEVIRDIRKDEVYTDLENWILERV
jgi:alpha-beta hydrolase superfamily lysophospholipase